MMYLPVTTEAIYERVKKESDLDDDVYEAAGLNSGRSSAILENTADVNTFV